MAAVHDGGLRKHEHLTLDSLSERLEDAARKVGTADGPGEEHAAGDPDALRHEARAPGGMAGGVAHRERAIPYPYPLPVGERAIGGRRRLHRNSEREALLHRVVVQLPVRRVQTHGRPGLPLETRHPHHVVQVRVREPDRDRRDVQHRDPLGDEFRLLPGVDDRAGAARLVHDDVAVLGELAVGDRNDLHDAIDARSFSRSAARYFSTAIAAVVASPTAVVIWRGSWLRTAPPADKPGSEGIIRASVPEKPPAS